MFNSIYTGRRVLITGHTGFKGAWLSQWLLELGAEVHGIALPPNTEPSLFSILGLDRSIASNATVDLRDPTSIQQAVSRIRPEIVLHLAAQPLVRLSYREPAETWATNVMGTIHLLEALRHEGSTKACVIVTSDKCYENREQIWGYREDDSMGGHDPYSSSKGAVEIAISSWRRSFFSSEDGMHLASGRAGNVIGGGDWSKDRIVVDFIKAITEGVPLTLRNPISTRPWQHVLEPLSGYLWLGAKLLGPDKSKFSQPFNFGPAESSITTVEELAKHLVKNWGHGHIVAQPDPKQPHEAGLLKLDPSKAKSMLGWSGLWDVPRTALETTRWYKAHKESQDMLKLTREQILSYESDAKHAGQEWTI